MAERILLIEDDARLADMVRRFLEEHGYGVGRSGAGSDGLDQALDGGYDAVVLDVMLPDMDGFEVCRRLRAVSDVPVIMLTARGDETDRIVGLELGADDYLPKPFSPRELLARLRAVLRRTQRRSAVHAPPLRFGRLRIDIDAHLASVDDKQCELTGYQFELLCALARSAGRALSRDDLMDRLQGHAAGAFDRSIDVHVSRLRQAIEDDPKRPRRILTVRGVGYLFARRQDEDESA